MRNQSHKLLKIQEIQDEIYNLSISLLQLNLQVNHLFGLEIDDAVTDTVEEILAINHNANEEAFEFEKETVSFQSLNLTKM